LAKGHGLPILGEPAKQPHWSAWQIKTNGHITLHFENDDSEEMSYSKAVLRAFFWQPC
jgi:hypothetical protein